MLNFTKLGLHFFHSRILKSYALNTKAFTTVILFFTLFFSETALAQIALNCPNANRCTSKDLEVVGAFLTANQCICTGGQTTTATLNMTIINKTGSIRTSFAFFATLVKTNPDGTTSSQLISRCSGPVPPNM